MIGLFGMRDCLMLFLVFPLLLMGFRMFVGCLGSRENIIRLRFFFSIMMLPEIFLFAWLRQEKWQFPSNYGLNMEFLHEAHKTLFYFFKLKKQIGLAEEKYKKI